MKTSPLSHSKSELATTTVHLKKTEFKKTDPKGIGLTSRRTHARFETMSPAKSIIGLACKVPG
jgi:hypothetical protein